MATKRGGKKERKMKGRKSSTSLDRDTSDAKLQDIDTDRPRSSISSGSLSSADLKTVLECLHPACHKWFNIGIQLDVDSSKLESIRSQYSSGEDCLREMLMHALKRRLSWGMIGEALKAKTVNEPGLLEAESDLSAHEDSNKLPQQYQLVTGENQLGACATVTQVQVRQQKSHQVYPVAEEEHCGQNFGEMPQNYTTTLHESFKNGINRSDIEKMPIWANEENVDHTFKVITIGDAGVGKTSLLQRFAKALPCDHTLNTIGFRCGEYCRVIAVKDGPRVKLELWDTCGTEKYFSSIPSNYFQKVDAAIIVFDVSHRKSYEHATVSDIDGREDGHSFKTWFKEVQYRLDDAKSTVIVLVGNKNDVKERQVSSDVATNFARLKDLDYIETSSKEDNNVDQLFFLVCQRILEKRLNVQPEPPYTSPSIRTHSTNTSNKKCRTC